MNGKRDSLTPYYRDEEVTIYNSDCRSALPLLSSDIVDCCLTSPPYFWLRDYGTATWEGGSPACEHWELRGGIGDASAKQVTSAGASTNYRAREICRKCGARRIDRQIGLERSPEAYVSELVNVFREVRRVLKPEGTLWLNLGDSYAQSGMGGNPAESKHRKQATNVGSLKAGHDAPDGFKPKDLLGIPWRVAFALQADGWYLRSDIIWAKPNPMPESVHDRPTRSHEYIFLLTKSSSYYYDQSSIAEDCVSKTIKKFTDGGRDKQRGYTRRHAGFNSRYARQLAESGAPTKRNSRDVWTITPQPFRGAHFAVFPQELARRCILAGCPAGGVMLDPFAGAGTVAVVSRDNNRKFIGFELNPTYIELTVERLCH